MPPDDRVTRFSGGGDRKVACETKISLVAASAAADLPSVKPDPQPQHLSLPFSEVHWVKVLHRGESTIGKSNPKSNRSSPKPNSSPRNLAAVAGAAVMKANGPIIAVPIKTKHSIFIGNSVQPVTNFRFFPQKNTVGSEKLKPAVPDPVSPKPSCFGSFFSRKVSDSSLSKSDSSVRDVEIQLKGARCLASLAAFLRYREGHPSISAEVAGDGSSKTSNDSSSDLTIPDELVEATPPELQAMKRVSPGNETELQSDVVDGVDGRCLVPLEPLDRESVLGTR